MGRAGREVEYDFRVRAAQRGPRRPARPCPGLGVPGRRPGRQTRSPRHWPQVRITSPLPLWHWQPTSNTEEAARREAQARATVTP